MEHSAGSCDDDSRPCVLITNDDGIHAPGLQALVNALVDSGICHVFVCAPDCDKSGASHSVTVYETLAVSPVNIKGAIAYAVSGTPVDCASLCLSGDLFPPKKFSLVLSGINKGCNCGYHTYYSGTVAAAREALICGVPAISLSLNWKRGQSLGSDFEAAAGICQPLIKAVLRDLLQGLLPSSLFLNIDIPTSLSDSKGFKVTKQGKARYPIRWIAASPQGRGAVSVMGGPRAESPALGKTEIEATAGQKNASESTCQQKLHFRMDHTLGDTLSMDSDYDFGALEEGFVSVTPLALVSQDDTSYFNCVADWVSSLSAHP